MAFPYNIPVAFSFDVTIPFFKIGNDCSFRDVSGLTVKIDYEKINEGGANDRVLKLPKRAAYNELVLKRGILQGSLLIAWINNAVRNFQFMPTPVFISLVNELKIPTVVWMVNNAFPVGIDVAEFKAQENALAVETLTLAYDYFERIG